MRRRATSSDSGLDRVQLVVAPLALEELGVPPALHDLSVLDHQDQIRPLDGREPVGNDQGGPVPEQ